jgi:molybdate transport system ATP-binding protein
MIALEIRKTLIGSGGPMILNLSTEIAERAFVALAGPSGSGKTTLLRILAGLEAAEGSIRVDGTAWLEGSKALAPRHREIGFVFQDYALFENMSVSENLLYVRKDPELATHLLELTGLSELRRRLPATLSGGQKQRVALCRALMNRPKLLLMDEPLSALDPQMRVKLQHDILALHREFGTTTVMVSHDPSEIYRLADRVIMLEQGRVVRDASPKSALMQAQGSQKFSLVGELLDIRRQDVIHVAVVAIGQQLVEVVLDSEDVTRFEIGERVRVSTKAFAPSLGKL